MKIKFFVLIIKQRKLKDYFYDKSIKKIYKANK